MKVPNTQNIMPISIKGHVNNINNICQPYVRTDYTTFIEVQQLWRHNFRIINLYNTCIMAYIGVYKLCVTEAYP